MFPAYSNGSVSGNNGSNRFNEKKVKKEVEDVTDKPSSSQQYGYPQDTFKEENLSPEKNSTVGQDYADEYDSKTEPKKYTTFAQRNPPDKRSIDRSYKYRNERERAQKAKKAMEFKKDLRIDQRLSYIRDESDSSDDPLRFAAADFELSDGEEHEVHRSEVLQVEVRNAPKISRRITNADRQKFSIRESDPYERYSRVKVKREPESPEKSSRRGDFAARLREYESIRNLEKSRKRRNSSPSSSSSSSSSDSSDDTRKKKRKRRHSTSSSSSSSDSDSEDYKRKRKKHKKKNKKKSKKKKSKSSKSSRGAELPKKHLNKWNFLKEFTSGNPCSFLSDLPLGRVYDGELVMHDHVHRSELALYDNRMKIILMPNRINSSDIHPLDKIFFGRKVEAIKKPRYLDRLKWSKKPENHFESIPFSATDDYMKLSHYQLKPYKDGWKQIEDEREREEFPDVFKEKEYMEAGERTTEGFLEEIVLDKQGSLEEKKNKLERILRHPARGDPNLEKAWIDRIDLEDPYYRREVLKAKEEDQRIPDKKAFNERKLQVIENAMKVFPYSIDIFSKKIEVLREDCDAEVVNKEFVSRKTAFMAHPRFWEMWIDLKMTDMKMYKPDNLDATFREFFEKIDGIANGTFNVVRQFCSRDELKASVIRMIYKRTFWYVHNGRISEAIAFAQLVCENLKMPKEIQDIFLDPKSDKKKIRESLSSYWDSGAARIGDRGSILWAKFHEDPKKYGEPELEDERKALEEEEMTIASKFPSNCDWKMVWLKLERAREKYCWRPIRSLYSENLAQYEHSRAHSFADIYVMSISPERMQFIATECVKIFGAKLPFEPSGEMSQILHEFGGFHHLPLLPSAVGDFADRFIVDLIKIIPDDYKGRFVAARILTKLVSFAREQKSAYEQVRSMFNFALRITSDGSDIPVTKDYSVPAMVLVCQEMIKVVNSDSNNQVKVRTAFHRSALACWGQLEKRHIKRPLKDRPANTMEFALFATVLYAIVKTCPSEKDVLSVLSHAVLRDTLTDWKVGVNVPGHLAIQASEHWAEIADSLKPYFMVSTDIYTSGLYSPYVLSSILNMRMMYACGNGPDLQRLKPIIENFSTIPDNPELLCVEYQAIIYKEVINIVKMHERQFHNCGWDMERALGMDLRKLVYEAGEKFPIDVDVIKEYIEMFSKTYMNRYGCAKELKKRHELVAENKCPKSTGPRQVLAVARIYLERIIFEKRMIGDDTQGAAGLLNKLTTTFREVAEIEHDPFIWRLLMHIHVERGEPYKAYEAYIQATAQCGWSRALHLDAAWACPDKISEIMAFMLQKDLTPCIDDAEVTLLLENYGKK